MSYSPAERFELTELANKLFMFTDAQQWDKLQKEVFLEEVWFDMTSMGAGPAQRQTGEAICEMWQQGFVGIDQVHHQAGHYLISGRENEADIFGYAIAIHYKKSATKGNTRTFVGSYELRAMKTAKGWRLNKFKYNLKFTDGNTSLE